MESVERKAGGRSLHRMVRRLVWPHAKLSKQATADQAMHTVLRTELAFDVAGESGRE
jgi:hypothetical protein